MEVTTGDHANPLHFSNAQWPSQFLPESEIPTGTEHDALPTPAKAARFTRKCLWISGAVVLVVALFIGLLVRFVPKARTSTHRDIMSPQVLSSASLDGQMFLLARGSDGQLRYTTREEGIWTLRWNTTGRQVQSQPASIVWGTPKRLSIFYVRNDNMVMTNSLRNGAWGNWEALGAKVSSPVVLCHEASRDIIHIWARENTDNKLIIHNYWEPSRDAWYTLSSDWEVGINYEMAKGASSTPAVVCRNTSVSNDVVLYDKDFNSALHKQWNTSRHLWEPWQDLGGSYAGDPVLVSPSADRIDFFGISRTSKALTHVSWNKSSTYTSLYELEGAWASVPSVTATTTSRLDVFALSINDILGTSAPLATLLDTQPQRIIVQVLGGEGDVLSSGGK
ncbi:unnamed protein product [Parascedosporium putredinis]|uniref:PLL-like beta propeller domain-containing protein n=1 Tax=Parascedosporium putredinis TaxID=1442378 RepID=A0A9P1MAL6_9PEZI|nr:unnamed protein product [Parascedosporium putredinis]CAI7994380.1 unnamed protein product [Parascedosporium putredinis]